jgi:hypothetical protein
MDPWRAWRLGEKLLLSGPGRYLGIVGFSQSRKPESLAKAQRTQREQPAEEMKGSDGLALVWILGELGALARNFFLAVLVASPDRGFLAKAKSGVSRKGAKGTASRGNGWE